MSSYEMEAMLEALAGSLSAFIGPIIASLLSGVILTYCIRWFIFQKAGEKGWKALIPFYSDYINYKIAWDGRIYLALLVGTIASSVLGALFGLINAGLGMVVSVIISTVVAGAKAVASMILQFKFARAFGKNDYFAVGLYFLNNVFAAILAFGECKYQGAPTADGIGVPKALDNLGRKPEPRYDAPVQQPRPVQMPPQPMQQPPQQGYQSYQPYGGYQQPRYPQQPNTGSYPPVPQYPQQNNQPPYQY